MNLVFRSALFITTRRKKTTLIRKKNCCILKTMVRSFCATCTVTGYPCSLLKNMRKTNHLDHVHNVQPSKPIRRESLSPRKYSKPFFLYHIELLARKKVWEDSDYLQSQSKSEKNSGFLLNITRVKVITSYFVSVHRNLLKLP